MITVAVTCPMCGVPAGVPVAFTVAYGSDDARLADERQGVGRHLHVQGADGPWIGDGFRCANGHAWRLAGSLLLYRIGNV